MQLMFLGASTCIPDKNDDCPSYVLNGKYCFDCGWALATNLIRYNIKPTDIKYLFFTHMHHDHYLSLPTILFYYLQTGVNLSELTIFGPKNEVEIVVKLATEFLQSEKYYSNIEKRYPNVIGLSAGDKFSLDDFDVEVIDSFHTVPGLCYKMTEKSTGKVFGTTGDTAYKREYGDFFKGCDAIAYETQICLCKDKKGSEITCRHSSVYDAVKTAKEANVNKIFVMHGPRSLEKQTLSEGKKIFDGEIIWPEIGKVYEI